MTRRTLLRNATHAVAAGSLGGLAPLLHALQNKTQRPDPRLIVRSQSPSDLETPVALLDSWITPNDVFFVRSHLPTPVVEPANWTLTIAGAVERPVTLRLDELKALPRTTLVATLECAGNGRAFFDPPVAGVQWRKGAVGNARWTGVRLIDVLKRAGLRASGQFVLLDGADRPVGTVPDFLRTLPMATASHPDTLLAFEMNGVPLPSAHGFPLRAIVPGWEGAYWVKWLTAINVLEAQHDGFFVQTAYRYPKRPVAPGAAVPANDMDPVTRLTVKSLITSPGDGAGVAADRLRVAGFAWTGEGEIAHVDVSLDNGTSWARARLGRDRARHAWRAFEYEWRRIPAGSYSIRARATDSRGRTQSESPPWNPSGYLWNAPDRVAITVGGPATPATPPALENLTLPTDDDTPLARQKCLVCHGADLIAQQRLNEAGWSRELDKMVRWGAPLADDERRRLLAYLVRHFPQR